MRDYNFNYLNYIPNIGNINYPNNYQTNNIHMVRENNTTNNTLTEPYLGFIRGNSFNSLYSNYKNYKPAELNPTNEKDALLYQLLQYKFAITDLKLYLDTNPNDLEMLKTLQKYIDIEKQISDKYESMYGPLTIDDVTNSNNYTWINSPWPWEVV